MKIDNNTTLAGKGTMPISKLGQRRQVVIPKDICDTLGIHEGDYVEVTQEKGRVIIKPKKLIDADDVLSPEEERLVRQGERQLAQGQSKFWKQLKQEVAR